MNDDPVGERERVGPEGRQRESTANNARLLAEAHVPNNSGTLLRCAQRVEYLRVGFQGSEKLFDDLFFEFVRRPLESDYCMCPA